MHNETTAFLAEIGTLAPINLGDVEGSRSRRRLLAQMFDSGPDAVSSADCEIAGVSVRRYGGELTGDALIVYVHGGGWITGDLDTHDGICRRLVDTTATPLVAIDYRRPPEHASPAAVDDVLAVVGELATEGRQLCVAGDSSGAHIVVEAVRQSIAGYPDRDIRAILLIQPACDPAMQSLSWQRLGSGFLLSAAAMRWYWTAYRGDDRRPLWDQDLSSLPETLVITSSLDPSADEAIALVDHLRAIGVTVEHVALDGYTHGCLTLPAAFPSLAQTIIAASQWLVGHHPPLGKELS